MGIYEGRQIHSKTVSRPVKSQDSRSGPHTNRMPCNKLFLNIKMLQLRRFPYMLRSRETFQFKQKNMTNVACFHDQHFLWGYLKYQSLCLHFQLLLKELIP